MPITLPPFVALQTQAAPLKGNWRRQPLNSDQSPQGDMFISIELDWPIGGAANGNAVQINVAGTSPVVLGQIAALVVDNSRCGSDVSFVFPDTGFELTVDARAQGVFVVLTNAMQFYAVAANGLSGDITILQVCNTVPPPVAQFPTSAQQNVSAAPIALVNALNAAVIPAGVNGTLKGFALNFVADGAGAMSNTCELIDNAGAGTVLWSAFINLPLGSFIAINSPPGLNLRFRNGVNFQIPGTATGGGHVTPNLYYTVP